MNKLQQWYYYKFLKASPVRTEKYTIPLKIVGWGWGHGKTYWYERDAEIDRLYKLWYPEDTAGTGGSVNDQ